VHGCGVFELGSFSTKFSGATGCSPREFQRGLRALGSVPARLVALYVPKGEPEHELVLMSVGAELKARGVPFRSEPEERFYGVEAMFQDDSGNWFSLTERRR
jgi:hypothetical protein